jgi:choice-of-anchor B domain-containing protein
MKKIFLSSLFIAMSFCAFAQFTSQNISLYARWFDSTVVQEPVFHIKYNSVWGWKNTVQNKEYAILGSSGGTFFIDVTNPSNPVKCDFVPGRRGNCVWREYKTYSHYAYLVSDDAAPNSLQIVDLNYLPDSVHVVYDSDLLFRTSHTVYIDGSRLYCGFNRTATATYSMAVYDLAANPELPVLLRTLNQDDPSINLVHDMFVRNDTVYASCGYQGLHVYKFTGTNFVSIGSLTNYPSSGYNHSSTMAPGKTKMVFCDEVPVGLPAKVVDVSNPANIGTPVTFESSPNATPHNPYMVENDKVVIAYYQDGVQIFDVSNTAAITKVGFFDTNPTDCPTCPNPNYSGCWGAYVDLPSGILLASDMQNGLFILNADSALGIRKSTLESDFFSVYPNPVEDQLTFQFKEGNAKNATLKIFDLNGKLLIEDLLAANLPNGKTVIPTNDLKKGLYFLTVLIDGKVYNNKFSKM